MSVCQIYFIFDKLTIKLKKMSIFTKIGEIVGGVVSPINNLLDNLITNKEELLEAKLKIETEINRKIETIKSLENQEMNSARNREIEINNSLNSSWLPKNVTSIIALFCIAIFSIILIFVYFGFGNSTEIIHTQILQGIFSIITMIIGYYFGSSHQKKNE